MKSFSTLSHTKNLLNIKKLSFRRFSSLSTETKKKYSICFLGTPSFAANCLKDLVEASKASDLYEVTSVVTQPPALVGRKKILTKSDVHNMAESLEIPTIFTPEKVNNVEFITKFQKLKPDLCITAAYGNFLTKKFLSVSPYGTINIHPSLLPKYRGPSPIQRSLENGDKEIGVCLLYTVSKMDAGPIISTIPYQLNGQEINSEVLDATFDLGMKELIRLLPQVFQQDIRQFNLLPETKPLDSSIDPSCSSHSFSASNQFNLVYQKDEEATHAPFLSRSEGLVNFSTLTSTQIFNKFRGFYNWPHINSFFLLRNNDSKREEVIRIKLSSLNIVTDSNLKENLFKKFSDLQLQTNQGLYEKIDDKNYGLFFLMLDNNFIQLNEVQIPTKKIESVEKFFHKKNNNFSIEYINIDDLSEEIKNKY